MRTNHFDTGLHESHKGHEWASRLLTTADSAGLLNNRSSTDSKKFIIIYNNNNSKAFVSTFKILNALTARSENSQSFI